MFFKCRDETPRIIVSIKNIEQYIILLAFVDQKSYNSDHTNARRKSSLIVKTMSMHNKMAMLLVLMMTFNLGPLHAYQGRTCKNFKWKICIIADDVLMIT